MPLTTIYLVRHAHADWNTDEGRPLSASGFAAASQLGERLAPAPIVAIYSSPHRRAVQTVEPLAGRVGVPLQLVNDLRERELPPVAPGEFERTVEDSWRSPSESIPGAESNAAAQARGLAVVRDLLPRHHGEKAVVATHGTLLALILNGLDPTFGFDFWRRLSFPDVYQLEFDGPVLSRVQRVWS